MQFRHANTVSSVPTTLIAELWKREDGESHDQQLHSQRSVAASYGDGPSKLAGQCLMGVEKGEQYSNVYTSCKSSSEKILGTTKSLLTHLSEIWYVAESYNQLDNLFIFHTILLVAHSVRTHFVMCALISSK